MSTASTLVFNDTLAPSAQSGLALSAREWRWAAAAALLAMLLRVACSELRGFWLDEYYTYMAAKMPLGEMIANRFHKGHSPLYFVYARLGLLLGNAEWMARLSSALALGATVLLTSGMMGAAGLRAYLKPFWALAIIHPYWFSAGIEYRYQITVIAVSAAVAWSAIVYTRRWSGRAGALLAALLGLNLWLHPSAQLIVPALVVYLIWEGSAQRRAAGASRRAAALRDIWPVVAGFLISMPLLFLVSGYKDPKDEYRWPDPWVILQHLERVTFGRFDLWESFTSAPQTPQIVLQLVLAVAALMLVRRRLRLDGNLRAWRLLGALLLMLPLTLAAVTRLAAKSLESERYIAMFSVPSAVCLAIAWQAALARVRELGPGWPANAWRAWLVITPLLLLAQGAASAIERGEYHREAILWMASHAAPDVALGYSSNVGNQLALEYLQYPHLERAKPVDGGARLFTADAARSALVHLFEHETKGFLLLYHDKYRLRNRSAELAQSGFFSARRRWRPNKDVTLIAVGRGAAGRRWVKSLPEPEWPWGPARGLRHDD